MLKPVAILVGALILTPALLVPAKAGETLSILTMMEKDKPVITINLSETMVGGMKVTAHSFIYDGHKDFLTTTTIAKDDFEFVGKNKEGKEVSYRFKSGTAILTTTTIKKSRVKEPKSKN